VDQIAPLLFAIDKDANERRVNRCGNRRFGGRETPPTIPPTIITGASKPGKPRRNVIVNLGIGLVTPPVGTTLFVGCAVDKVTIEQVMTKIWPFYGAMLVTLALVTYVPAISVWLPGLFKF